MAFQDTEAIKYALLEELKNILSPDTNTRRLAEERMGQLKYTDGYGVYLAEITVNQSHEIALRQLASVMLKQYVESSWGEEATIQASEQAKKIIKSILPEGLYDQNSKIRSVIAYTISAIASYDWPADWGELFEIIVKCLGGNEPSIHGAMQVLVEFTYELNSQISDCGPIILSEVYRIFEADQIYNVKTRACAVNILCCVLKSINIHVTDSKKVADMVNPILPSFIQKMIEGLTVPIGSQSSFTLKSEIVRVLVYMIIEMPKFISPYIPQILPPIWRTFTQMADIYIKVVVNAVEESPFQDDEEDDDQFNRMILQIFEFVSCLIESKKFKSNVENVIGDLIYICILYMQITEDQNLEWTENTEKFVDDEDEEDSNYSVRVSCACILEHIGSTYGNKTLPALNDALLKHAAVADANRQVGDPNWWKIHEASIAAVCTYKSLIFAEPDKFNLTEYLNMVHKTFLDCENPDAINPYLTGRCLMILGHFVDSKIFNAQMLQVLLENVVNALGTNKPNVLKICATRAVRLICENLMGANEATKRIVSSKLSNYFDGIVPMVGTSQNNELALFLETISVMFTFDQSFVASISGRAIPLTIAIFLKHHDDRYILELVQDIMKILSQNPYCVVPLQEKLIPTLVSILNMQGEQSNSALQDIALNVLETIVKHSQTPLSDVLIESAFPAAVQCVLRTEDHSVMQSGSEVMRVFVFKAPEQVCRYRNGEGLNWIMQVTTMLLNPQLSEHSATFIGRLIITIITKAGNYLGAHIDLLLKAVISKMQLCKSLSVNMSLIMTFAHLLCFQMNDVLNFLSTVPGPSGEPAMIFVLTHWLSRHHLFYGMYERKVSTISLCRLFEYGITSKDSRFINIQIKEPQQIPSNVRSTRSTAAATQTQWVQIPVLLKILKLLINELAMAREMQLATHDDSEDEDDDDAAADTSGHDLLDVSQQNTSINLRQMMLDDEDTECDENDQQMMEDLLKDPIFQANIEETLCKFVKNFMRDEQFNLFKPMLNESELQTLNWIETLE